MKLYYAETGNGRKACAVAKYLNLPIEYVRVNLATGEQRLPSFLGVNPNGKIPVLVDGEVRLWESRAIMCYLAYKAGSDLWPRDELEKIDVVRWLTWDTAHFSRHALPMFFERVVKPMLGMGETNEQALVDETRFFKQSAAVLNDYLRGRHYLVGNHLTVADFSVGAYLAYVAPARIPIEEFSEIQRWNATLMAIPAWREPFPK